MPGRHRKKGYALAFAYTYMSAGTYIFAKPALDILDPLTFSLCQFSLGTFLVGILALAGRVPIRPSLREHLGFVTVQSFFYVLGIYCNWAGLHLTHPTFVALVNRLELVLIVILGIYLFRERFSRWESAGTAIAFVGVIVLRIGTTGRFGAGFWWIVAGAVFFTLAELAAKRKIAFIHPIAYTFMRGTLMVAFMLAAVALSRLVPWLGEAVRFGMEPAPVGDALPYIIGAAVVGPFLGRTLYFYSLRFLEISKVSVIAQTQPVMVALFAFLVFGALPTPREAVAGALIILGCLVLVLRRPARRVGP